MKDNTAGRIDYKLNKLEKSLKNKADEYNGHKLDILAPGGLVGGLIGLENVTFSCNEKEIIDYLGSMLDIESQFPSSSEVDRHAFAPRRIPNNSWTMSFITKENKYCVNLRGFQWLMPPELASALYFVLKDYIYTVKSQDILLNFIKTSE